MLIIVNLGKISQRVLSWEEAVTEFNLSDIAIYGQKITLSCGTTLTFVKDQTLTNNNILQRRGFLGREYYFEDECGIKRYLKMED